MDEAAGKPPVESPNLDPKIAQQLESARKLLFDEDFIPEGCEDMIRPKTGRLALRDRAMMAFNNLMIFLPGTWSDGSIKPQGDVQDQQFITDFAATASKHGLDMKHVEELNHGEKHSSAQFEEDSVFELYKYVYPAMEELIKEKGYRVIW